VQHLVDNLYVDCVPPACLDPRPRVGVVKDLSLSEVPAVRIDPAVVHGQRVVSLYPNGCLVFIVGHDVELTPVWMAEPAFAIRRCGARAPPLHGSIVASELCVLRTTCRRLEDWVARLTIAYMGLCRRGCSGVEGTGADRPFERVKQRPLKTPNFIEGVEVRWSDPSKNLGEGHPNPL